MNPTLSAGGHLSETIAAISTAAGEGAIALLRMSGPESVAIAERIFQGRKAFQKMESHRQYHGAIVDGDRKLDEVLLAVHRAPRSYTGEDVVEIACHGGLLVTRRILELLLRRGARPARPGEFTQRAYLNGKLDLTQAEAVMDLITAQSDRALAAAQQQLEGRLGERLRALRASYLETLAHLEAFIDFPEEDITPETGEELRARCQELCAQIAGLLSTAERGRHWREGVKTVIFGAPNVGKSSLLNLLLGYERAIVSAQPGTTRDALEETVNVRGIPLRLVDTAGIRDATEEAERAGIARTFQQAGRADLILHLQDAGAPPSREAAPDPTKAILVLNKCDLAENPAWHGREGIRISCREQTGLATLEEAIERRVLGASGSLRSHELAINIRHETGLRQALDFTERTAAGLAANAPPELIAEDLRAAADAVGEIVGRVDSEDVLGRIFSTFCIGK